MASIIGGSITLAIGLALGISCLKHEAPDPNIVTGNIVMSSSPDPKVAAGMIAQAYGWRTKKVTAECMVFEHDRTTVDGLTIDCVSFRSFYNMQALYYRDAMEKRKP